MEVQAAVTTEYLMDPDVKRMYEAGHTMEDISEYLGVTQPAVRASMVRQGLQGTHRNALQLPLVHAIRDALDKDLTFDEVLSTTGCSVSAMQTVCRAFGYPHPQVKHTGKEPIVTAWHIKHRKIPPDLYAELAWFLEQVRAEAKESRDKRGKTDHRQGPTRRGQKANGRQGDTARRENGAVDVRQGAVG